MNQILQLAHRAPDMNESSENPFGLAAAREAQAYHRGFPEYRPTPLVSLGNLARALGVGKIWVKDESPRFGLNAFKALGGSYAIGKTIARRMGRSRMDFAELTDAEVRRKLGALTFATATDGNHGRGVAWTAHRLGFASAVYMPKGSARERLENIRALGAHAEITDMNYDDTVRFVRRRAEQAGWVLVQDTDAPDYAEIPLWIMQGYTTMGAEILDQLRGERPTHVVLQAGVGSMAGAMAAFFGDAFSDRPPRIIIVEPERADCIFRTARASDGKLHAVGGDLNTIMAGLACGEPCALAWKMLRRFARDYASMPDWVSAEGMRILGNPLGDDPRVVSGESGAAGLGFTAEVLRNARLRDAREELGMGADARILCISTEGDTDAENYRRIVWDGAHPRP